MILEAEEEEKKSANEQKQHPEQKKLKDKGDASNTKAKATAEKKPAKKPAKGKNQFFIFGVFDAVKQKLMNSKDNQEDDDRVSRKLGKYNSIIHKIKEVEKSLEMEKYSQDHVVFDSQQQ